MLLWIIFLKLILIYIHISGYNVNEYDITYFKNG
jgi:hypothetical protein